MCVQQMIMKKVAEKLPATAQTVKFVVPNELVSKIIGKGGAAIKKLQSESGATVQVAKDLATDHVPVGRNVVLTGNIRQIAVAHYNVMRMLVMDKEFPADWRGGIPLPFNAPRPPMSQPPHPPGAPMMPPHPAGPQRGRMGMQPPSAGMMGGPITYTPIGPAGPPPMMAGAAAGGAAQALTRFETVVPEYSVSYIIGKKGSYVNEIQRSTSTNIEVAKVRPSAFRIVVVILADTVLRYVVLRWMCGTDERERGGSTRDDRGQPGWHPTSNAHARRQSQRLAVQGSRPVPCGGDPRAVRHRTPSPPAIPTAAGRGRTGRPTVPGTATLPRPAAHVVRIFRPVPRATAASTTATTIWWAAHTAATTALSELRQMKCDEGVTSLVWFAGIWCGERGEIVCVSLPIWECETDS